jgi:hypothetical protein
VPRHAGRRLGLVVAASLLPLAACGSGVLVDAYPTAPGTDVDCAALIADLPSSVDGLDRRTLEQDVPAAAWGDPPVVLRCGVPTPEAFEPTSECKLVDGVDWFDEQTADGFRFTTVGRRANVEVDVPAVHDPAADVLVDLAESIDKHLPVEQPCRG